jgi:hypothetical protein
MDQSRQHPDDALRQRFRDLTEHLHHVHESWQEAHHQHDVARQLDRIDREHALLAELHEVIAAFRENLDQRRASYGQPPERKP